jgi:hypothetical protein
MPAQTVIRSGPQGRSAGPRVASLLTLCLLAPAAWAQPASDDERAGFLALVVGSNRPGPGQAPLGFAEDDARRVAEVLIELGGLAPQQVRVVLGPSRDELLAALDEAARELAALEAQGRPTAFTFYYSGHARARALSLGPEELGLDELRARLLQLPARLTLAILDACQTGAISGIKGAEPAADFSHSSVSELHATGVAIMASSSGSELSQESQALGASFFTHHLVAGLRGAADADRDGRVTLHEAYRYAYHRTLASTAATAVGKQHVTLEDELKGKGELVLTFPERSQASLELGRALEAEVLLERLPAGSVVAELHKAQGEALRLALPAGEYSALLRVGPDLLRCPLRLADGEAASLAPERCQVVPLEEVTAKGEAEAPPAWGLELGAGLRWGGHDGYDTRLSDFGFEEQIQLFAPAVSARLGWSFLPYVGLWLRFDMLQSSSYRRETQDPSGEERGQDFSWRCYGLGLYLRGQLPLLDGWLVPYLEAGGGLSMGFTRYHDGQAEVDEKESFAGWQLGAAAGLQLMPWRNFGFFGEVAYSTAPSLENLVGDSHDGGGFSAVLGLRGAL